MLEITHVSCFRPALHPHSASVTVSVLGLKAKPKHVSIIALIYLHKYYSARKIIETVKKIENRQNRWLLLTLQNGRGTLPLL